VTTVTAPPPQGNAVALFDRALGLLRLGQMDSAELLCRKIIEAEPQHPDALHVLGVVALHKGRTESGAALIRQSLASNPDQADVHCSLGNAFRDLGRPSDALASYRRALQLAPDFAGALYSEGNALMDLHRADEALQSYDRALALQQHYPEAYLSRGNALLQIGRLEDALASYQRALALQPNLTMALANCVTVLRKLGRLQEALNLCDRLLELQIGDPDVCIDRGILLYELERYQEAIGSLNAALLQKPGSAAGRFCCANALLKLKQFERALLDCDVLLECNPALAQVHCLRGLVLLQLARPADALSSFAAALRLEPKFVEAVDGQGSALRQLNRPGEALAAFEYARGLAPASPDILYRCAVTLRQLGRHADAAAAFASVLRLAPHYDYAAGGLLHERLLLCDWTAYQELVVNVRGSVRAAGRACLPGMFLSVSDSAEEQLQCARAYVSHRHPPQTAPLSRARRHGRSRICVAYLSADFREHPVSYLMAGVFEHHDRERFESVAISLQPAQDSQVGRRIQGAFAQFIDVSRRSDREVIALMRELEVDIAVDLMGFSSGSRPDIFSARPAPVQVNFLGHPGTLGSSCYDYILADRHVIPEQERVFYAEKVVWLPHCFQPNDDRRPTPAPCSRLAAGLPQHGFVFCAFNTSYKINPMMFDIWCRLLRETPGSVLWVVSPGTQGSQNLVREAGARGIAPERLVFAASQPYADHLSRIGQADLFLDTLPFNGGTTASDFLWAGVPVLTCVGGAFAARMASSLLHALGLPELTVESFAEYQQRALELAHSPTQLAELRTRLASARSTAALFDTARYCRDLESAYIRMSEGYRRGMPPQHFAVDG
jgi:protein O-GlcNAc transferase